MDTKNIKNSKSKTSKTYEKSKKIIKKKTLNLKKIDIEKISDIVDNEKKKMDLINKKKISNNLMKIVHENDVNNYIANITSNVNKTDSIQKAIETYQSEKKFLKDHGITISTITLDCKLHTPIDVDKFAKNVILREDEIVSVKFGNRKDPATNRTIVVIKNKKKPSVKNFYNQVTILMKPMNNPSHNYINIKVFKNGSLQMTGCKDMDDFNNVTTTLIKILKIGRKKKDTNGKISHIKFIEEPDKIGIFDVKIRMINSNFKLNYKIDRKKLAKLLKKYHGKKSKDKDIGYVECKYEPNGGHSCVNIKHQYDEKSKPSIFVFQTGAIIITGAKNLHHIIMAYHFIIKILERYYNEIRIIDLDQNKVHEELIKFYKSKSRQFVNV